MPITRQQFDFGIDNTIQQFMEKLTAILHDRHDEAFSLDELRGILGVQDPQKGDPYGANAILATIPGLKDDRQVYWERFQIAVDRLVASKVVRERKIAGISYFVAGDRPLADAFSNIEDAQRGLEEDVPAFMKRRANALRGARDPQRG